MREGDPKRKVPEQGGRTPGRKDYPAKRVPAGRRPVTPPDDTPPQVGAEATPRRPMSPADLDDARAAYIDIIGWARREGVLPLGNSDPVLAESAGVDESVFKDFRLGLTDTPDLDTIIGTLVRRRIVTEEDSQVRRLREIWERYSPPVPKEPEGLPAVEEAHEAIPQNADDVRWLRTLTRPGMTLGDGIRCLRLSVGLSQDQFAEITGKHKNSIKENENNKKPPSPPDLKIMMGVAGLDVDGKAAQFLRLQSEEQKVWSLDDLQTRRIGDLIKYLRISRGVTQVELGDALGVAGRSVIGIETGRHKTISKNTRDAFIRWLNLPKDSALAYVFKVRCNNPTARIPDDILQRVLEERHLFMENIQQIPPYPLSDTDTTLLADLQQKSSFGERIKLIVERGKGSEDPEILDKFWSSRKRYGDYVRNLIQEKFSNLQEYRLASLLNVYHYDIHHPITWYILNQVRPMEEAINQE